MDKEDNGNTFRMSLDKLSSVYCQHITLLERSASQNMKWIQGRVDSFKNGDDWERFDICVYTWILLHLLRDSMRTEFLFCMRFSFVFTEHSAMPLNDITTPVITTSMNDHNYEAPHGGGKLAFSFCCSCQPTFHFSKWGLSVSIYFCDDKFLISSMRKT